MTYLQQARFNVMAMNNNMQHIKQKTCTEWPFKEI